MLEPWMLWLIASVVALAIELLTGSFFLLVLALGLGGASLMALAGTSLTLQIVTVSLVTLAGWAVVWKRRGRRQAESAHSMLDPGENVEVLAWTAPDRCRIRYRGTEWGGRLVGPRAGNNRYVISRVDGTNLEIVAET